MKFPIFYGTQISHCPSDNSPPPAPIVGQMNPIHTPNFISLISTLTIILIFLASVYNINISQRVNVLSRHLPARNEENNEIVVRTACLQKKIQELHDYKTQELTAILTHLIVLNYI
jgi:cell division protein FtsB